MIWLKLVYTSVYYKYIILISDNLFVNKIKAKQSFTICQYAYELNIIILN